MRLQRLRHGMLSARSFQNMCDRTCLRYVAEVHTAWALEVLSAQPCQIFSLCSVEPGHAQYIHVHTYTSAVHMNTFCKYMYLESPCTFFVCLFFCAFIFFCLFGLKQAQALKKGAVRFQPRSHLVSCLITLRNRRNHINPCKSIGSTGA